MKKTSILSLSILSIVIAGCNTGAGNDFNQPILNVIPWQSLGENILTCQHKMLSDGELISGLLKVSGVDANGNIVIGTYINHYDVYGCMYYPATVTKNNDTQILQLQNLWYFVPPAIILPHNTTTATNVLALSDNGITVGFTTPTNDDILAAIGNESQFIQLSNNFNYFSLSNTVNRSLYAISTNGKYVLGSYTDENPFIVFSYSYNIVESSYNFKMNQNQFNAPYSKNNPNLIKINNQGKSVGFLDTNDLPGSKIGVYCQESGSCNTILPTSTGQGLTDSAFALLGINNTGVMVGEETDSYGASESLQVKFFDNNAKLIRALGNNYGLMYNFSITDDNVAVVHNDDYSNLYFYSLDSNQYFDFASVMHATTGWDDNYAINNGVQVTGVSQNGKYLYGSLTSSTPEGAVRVPYTIYFNKGIGYYLNNVYKNESGISSYKSKKNVYNINNQNKHSTLQI